MQKTTCRRRIPVLLREITPQLQDKENVFSSIRIAAEGRSYVIYRGWLESALLKAKWLRRGLG